MPAPGPSKKPRPAADISPDPSIDRDWDEISIQLPIIFPPGRTLTLVSTFNFNAGVLVDKIAFDWMMPPLPTLKERKLKCLEGMPYSPAWKVDEGK